MKVTSAAKVGFTAILVVLALVAVYRGLGWDLPLFPDRSGESYEIYVKFETVKGLRRGVDVMLNGNPIGGVEAIDNDGFGGVLVTLKISTRMNMHEHAKFVISRDSIFGSYLVSIEEPRSGIMTAPVVDGQFILKMESGAVAVGGPVVLNGEEIGRITGIEPADIRSEHVTVTLDSTVEVNDKMAFVPTPALGDVPSGITVYNRIAPGSTVPGEREPGPEDLVVAADKALLEITDQAGVLMAQLGVLLDKVSESLEPEEIRATLDALASEATIIATNISSLTVKLNALLDETQPHLIATTENVEAITENANLLVEGLTEYNDPEFRENIEELILNLNEASESLVSILDDIEEYTSDDVMREDIKAAIHEARFTIEEARGTLDAAEGAIENVSTGMNIFGGIETSAEFVLRTEPEDDRWAGDLNVKVGLEGSDTFVEAGVDDIGENDLINAQIGWWIEPEVSARVGIHRGKIGLGTEWNDSQFRIKGDLYNLNDLQWDLYGGYAIIPELGIIIGIEDLLDDDELNFGLAFWF